MVPPLVTAVPPVLTLPPVLETIPPVDAGAPPVVLAVPPLPVLPPVFSPTPPEAWQLSGSLRQGSGASSGSAHETASQLAQQDASSAREEKVSLMTI
jgi:hypothetical protein